MLLSAEQLRLALLDVDARLLELSASEGDWNDGATALLAILTDGHLQLAQVGDSQAALCSIGSDSAWLCPQHRIGDASEDARLAALGAVVQDGRLVGDGGVAVAVTRSLGDAAMKRHGGGSDAAMKRNGGSGLIADPDVREHAIVHDTFC